MEHVYKKSFGLKWKIEAFVVIATFADYHYTFEKSVQVQPFNAGSTQVNVF